MIYIHVPFCKSRCIYCDFFSTTCTGEWYSRYYDALLREMDARADEMRRASAKTIYIGGGTPSQLPEGMIANIINYVLKTTGETQPEEVTIEANPDDVTQSWIDSLKHTCVNRISMGVQSFDDNMLKLLRRRHTCSQVLKAVESCRKAGYENLSLDLMYGLPTQTLPQWESDVRMLLDLTVPHLSAYSLQREEGTVLDKLMETGELSEADEELSLMMYERLMEMAENAGYEHYEISNFAQPGYHSHHNSGYWNDTPYVGLGPGAHSYDGETTRRWNLSNLEMYCTSGSVPCEYEHLSAYERYNEKVMTRLRTSIGINLSELSEIERKHTLSVASPHIDAGRMTTEKGFLRLTKAGIFTSNDIMSDFML